MTLSSCTNIYTNIHSLSQFCTCHNLHFFSLSDNRSFTIMNHSFFWWFLHILSCLFVCLVLKIYAVCVGNYSFSKKLFQEIPVRKIIWCFKLFMVGGSIKSICEFVFQKGGKKNILKMTLLCLAAGSKIWQQLHKIRPMSLRMTKSSL